MTNIDNGNAAHKLSEGNNLKPVKGAMFPGGDGKSVFGLEDDKPIDQKKVVSELVKYLGKQLKENSPEMPEKTRSEIKKLAREHLNKEFSANPGKLESFIKKVEKGFSEREMQNALKSFLSDFGQKQNAAEEPKQQQKQEEAKEPIKSGVASLSKTKWSGLAKKAGMILGALAVDAILDTSISKQLATALLVSKFTGINSKDAVIMTFGFGAMNAMFSGKAPAAPQPGLGQTA